VGILAVAVAAPAAARTRTGPRGGPDFRPVARSAHATYFAERGGRVDVARSEVFLERLGTLFPPPPGGWGIEFYLHRSTSDLRERVGYSVSGLTDMRTGRIDSAWGYHPHELVHAVAGRLGIPPPLFSEGLAVALTARGELRGRDVDEVAAREMRVRATLEPFLVRFAEQDALVSYAVAGSFVGFLLERYGIDPMVSFLEGCGRSSSRHEAAFRRAYGRSVARASVEWMARLREERRAPRAWQEPSGWPLNLRRGASPALAAALPGAAEAAGPSAALAADPVVVQLSGSLSSSQ
jgi:hypothetical protein